MKKIESWSKNKVFFDRIWSKYNPKLSGKWSFQLHESYNVITDVELSWREKVKIGRRKIEIVKKCALNLHVPTNIFKNLCKNAIINKINKNN